MDRAELRERVDALKWFHTIDLGQGVTTPGTDDSATKLARLQLPRDLSGKRVLDIGAYDGFFSFEAEHRNAAQVLSIDTLAWQRGEESGRPCFDLAHAALGSKVETRELDVRELDRTDLGGFDLVLCLGVLYHLRDPLHALERIATIADDLLVLETHTDSTRAAAPSMTFYENDELGEDASNWWGPNESALEAFLRDVGFREIEIVHRRPLSARITRALYRSGGNPARAMRLSNQGRVAIHARK